MEVQTMSGDNGVSSRSSTTEPLPSETEYNILAGTQILITLKNGYIYEGMVVVNPIATRNKRTIELINVTNRTSGFIVPDLRVCTEEEIESFRILHVPTVIQNTIIGIENATCLINSKDKLNSYLYTILANKVREIGMAFFGVNSGRFGTIRFIAFFYGNSFTAIDVVQVQESNSETPVWKLLQHTIFENESVMKVVHNSRPIIDYLFHEQRIRIRNVYDTQLMDFILTRRHRHEKVAHHQKMIPLYAALKRYLEEKVKDGQIVFLKYYFKHPSLKLKRDNPFLTPFPSDNCRKLMVLYVKFLVPMKEEMDYAKNNVFGDLMPAYLQRTINIVINDTSFYEEDAMTNGLNEMVSTYDCPNEDQGEKD